jgi:hypothetical protein
VRVGWVLGVCWVSFGVAIGLVLGECRVGGRG